MKLIIASTVSVVVLLGLAIAATPNPSASSATLEQIGATGVTFERYDAAAVAKLMLELQTRGGMTLTILGSAVPVGLENTLTAAVYGWKDCGGSFLCLGGTAYQPMNVRVLTGVAAQRNFDLIAYSRGIAIPLFFGSRRADVYTVKDVPTETLWYLSGPGEEYVLIGGLLGNKMGPAMKLSGVGLATGYLANMFIDRIINTQAGRYAP